MKLPAESRAPGSAGSIPRGVSGRGPQPGAAFPPRDLLQSPQTRVVVTTLHVPSLRPSPRHVTGTSGVLSWGSGGRLWECVLAFLEPCVTASPHYSSSNTLPRAEDVLLNRKCPHKHCWSGWPSEAGQRRKKCGTFTSPLLVEIRGRTGMKMSIFPSQR